MNTLLTYTILTYHTMLYLHYRGDNKMNVRKFVEKALSDYFLLNGHTIIPNWRIIFYNYADISSIIECDIDGNEI